MFGSLGKQMWETDQTESTRLALTWPDAVFISIADKFPS